MPNTDGNDLPKLKRIVRTSIDILLLNDLHLIKYKANEVSISSKLALYLSLFLKNYDVDIEYNREGFSVHPKNIDVYFPTIEQITDKQIPKKYQLLTDNLFGSNLSKLKDKDKLKDNYNFLLSDNNQFVKSKKNIRPDIIVHRRGDDKKNLLAIEIKKDNDPESAYYDIIKLYHLRLKHNYRHAVFIQIMNKNEKIYCNLYWIYKNKNEIKFCKEIYPMSYK